MESVTSRIVVQLDGGSVVGRMLGLAVGQTSVFFNVWTGGLEI